MIREIMVRPERCLGCHSCEMACAIAHTPAKNLAGALLAGQRGLKQIYVEQVDNFKAPVVCRHCDDAPCIAVCATHSLHRTEDGLVTNEDRQEQCLGCWMCAIACPFGMIRQDAPKRRALKCDRQCLDDKDIPACVGACPTSALVYTDVAAFEAERRRQQVANLQAGGAAQP
ncbi:MAG TPA: 4Fe-4S dicluster domain-containing protein [Patescibacteria group bacterium]|nr:4Fe-4S dicluster domain-containing protein [Patescibacteria group bacterium]